MATNWVQLNIQVMLKWSKRPFDVDAWKFQVMSEGLKDALLCFDLQVNS